MASGGSDRYKIDDTGMADSVPASVDRSSHSHGAAVLALRMRKEDAQANSSV